MYYNGNGDKTGLWVGLGLVGLLIIVIFSMGISARNAAASFEVEIPNAISDENILENRKVVLFTELVDAIKASTAREEEILTKIAELRSGGKSESSAISITAEAYPELKSIENYNQLMTEMALTENGIATQRKAINAKITEYKKLFKLFPSSLFLSGYPMVDFPLFKVDVSSDNWKAEW